MTRCFNKAGKVIGSFKEVGKEVWDTSEGLKGDRSLPEGWKLI